MTNVGDSRISSLSRREICLAAAGAAAAGLAPKARAAETDPAALTLSQASQMLRSRKVSPVELTEACLKRIERYNGALSAYITVTAEEALKTARVAEAEQRRGNWKGPLHGVPIALKDNIDTAGVRTTAASGVFKDRVPAEDADVVRKLKAAGAVILGKTNLHEFAYGGTSAVSYFGAVHNPWALEHITGGSSGGSAAATAADLCIASLGTDTGGSVRIPSSYCGVVGLKPTYGRVSIRGVIPLAWSLDHVGPICKSVEDTALMLAAIAGFDPMDPTAADAPVPDYGNSAGLDVSKLRWATPRTPFFDDLDPEVAQAVDTAITVLRKISGHVVEARLPAMGALFGPVAGAEASAYHEKWLSHSADLYQPSTRDIILGRGADVKAAAYAEALHHVHLARRAIANTFKGVDLLITPTMPNPPETLARAADFNNPVPPADLPRGIRNTLPFNVLGLPTISIPCGFTHAGLPIGLQISGGPFAELTVLAMARAYERETEWHKHRPSLAA